MTSSARALEAELGYRPPVRSFLPVRSVVVMGDGRACERVVALRAVQAQDFMTAHRVRGINRVVYDVCGKPPATIEWEKSTLRR